MLRQQFSDALKQAMRANDDLARSTVRLVIARLKERDIEQRGKGKPEGLDDSEIQQMLQGMIKQRRESADLYTKGARPELAEKEMGEIAIIERFLPKQLGEAEVEAAIRETIAAIGAAGIKDMGRTMAALRERHAGQLDPAKASPIVKRMLG